MTAAKSPSNAKTAKKEAPAKQVLLFLEAPPGFEPGIRVLQTRALPLGYVAEY